MDYFQATILALFVAAIAAISVPTARAAESVVVAAQEAEAKIAPRAANERLIRLPRLEFGLRAAIKCTDTAESLTLSIADTFVTLGEDILQEQRSAEAILAVPARQIALAASSKFCLRDDTKSEEEMLVPGLATVHASLHCTSEEGVTVLFASAPLQVRLLCDRPPGSDQDQSSDK